MSCFTVGSLFISFKRLASSYSFLESRRLCLKEIRARSRILEVPDARFVNASATTLIKCYTVVAGEPDAENLLFLSPFTPSFYKIQEPGSHEGERLLHFLLLWYFPLIKESSSFL